MNKDLSVGPTAVADKRYTQTFIRLEAYKANPWNVSKNPVEYWAHQNTYETRYSPITVTLLCLAGQTFPRSNQWADAPTVLCYVWQKCI